MKESLFTQGNIKKFFHTPTDGLPTNVAVLVKALGEGYGKNASTVLEGAAGQPLIAEPVIRGMISSYSFSVSLIANGWGTAGNA